MGSQDDASFREKVENIGWEIPRDFWEIPRDLWGIPHDLWGIPRDLWWGMETVDQCTPTVMIKPLTRWLFFALKT